MYNKNELTVGIMDIDPELNKEMVEQSVKPIFNALQASENIINGLDHINMKETRERIKAMTREEMMIAASVIPKDILLEALSNEFKRLNELEEKVKNLL